MNDESDVTRLPDRLPDYGPRYKEPPADPYSPTAPSIAEPFNAVTAAFFVERDASERNDLLGE